MIQSELIDGYKGDAHVTVEQIGDSNVGTYGPDDYVLDCGRNLDAQVITNNKVRIFDGVMVYRGRRDAISANSYTDVAIDNGSQSVNRNDIIVRRYTKDETSEIESSQFAVIKGTPGESAVDPIITTGDIRSGATLHEMALYRVKIEGLNIVAVEPMFQVLMSMKELQEQADELNSKLNDDRIGFPNYAKTIGTYTNTGFTAPENCWAKIESTSGWSSTTLNVNGNGVIIQQIKNTDSYPIRTSVMIPLKKGDVVTMSSSTSVNGITAVLYPMR